MFASCRTLSAVKIIFVPVGLLGKDGYGIGVLPCLCSDIGKLHQRAYSVDVWNWPVSKVVVEIWYESLFAYIFEKHQD